MAQEITFEEAIANMKVYDGDGNWKIQHREEELCLCKGSMYSAPHTYALIPKRLKRIILSFGSMMVDNHNSKIKRLLDI